MPARTSRTRATRSTAPRRPRTATPARRAHVRPARPVRCRTRHDELRACIRFGVSSDSGRPRTRRATARGTTPRSDHVDDHVAGRSSRRCDAGACGIATLFILTADHGEALGEHDYDSARLVRVRRFAPRTARRPRTWLFVRDGASPARSAWWTSCPRSSTRCGVPPASPLEGRSLRPMLDAPADRDAFAQTYYGEGLVALRAGPLEYVFKPPYCVTGRTSSGIRPRPAGRGHRVALRPRRRSRRDPTTRSRRARRTPPRCGRVCSTWLADQDRRTRGKTRAAPEGRRAAARARRPAAPSAS